MLPTLGLQLGAHSLRIDHGNPLAPSNAADGADRHPMNPSRHTLVWRSREQEFVIISAVECVAQLDLQTSFPDGRPRKSRNEDFCSHSRLFANVRKVGREAVAQIDHGACKALRSQKLADNDPWDRMKVPGKIRDSSLSTREQLMQCRRGAPQLPGNINPVPGARSRTQNRRPARYRSKHDDVRENPC